MQFGGLPWFWDYSRFEFCSYVNHENYSNNPINHVHLTLFRKKHLVYYAIVMLYKFGNLFKNLREPFYKTLHFGPVSHIFCSFTKNYASNIFILCFSIIMWNFIGWDLFLKKIYKKVTFCPFYKCHTLFDSHLPFPGHFLIRI